MKINKLVIRGEKQTNLSVSDPAAILTLTETYVIGAVSRGVDADKHTITLGKDQLVEFVFEDNTVWMSSDETIQDLFPEAAAVKKRDGSGEFEVPFYVQSGGGTRSLASDAAVKLLNVFTKKTVQKTVQIGRAHV